jgi:hypothetical protein
VEEPSCKSNTMYAKEKAIRAGKRRRKKGRFSGLGQAYGLVAMVRHRNVR